MRQTAGHDEDPLATNEASPAGLTRGSILFAKLEERIRKKMDCRVKPGNDDLITAAS
jgi:hypothetical protein